MIEFTCGILVAISIYLLLSKILYRKLFGFILLGTVINLGLLFAGRLTNKQPAFVSHATKHVTSNPVPQALILTAIVIGFGLLIFLCVLFRAIEQGQS